MDLSSVVSPFFGGVATQLVANKVYSSQYWTPLVERFYRIGMRYMLDAGYDPNEAPEALLRISEKHPEKFQNDPLE